MNPKSEINSQIGFSLVEVLMAVTVLSIVVTSLAASVYYGQDSARAAGERARAVSLAEEALEAARNIRDENPADPLANLVNGTHGLSLSGNQWSLSGVSDTTDIFQRELVISAIDDNTRQLTANVSWDQGPQRLGEVISLTTRLTKWLTEAAAAFGNWDVAIFRNGCVDLAGTNDGSKVAVEGDYAYIIRNGGSPNFAVVNIANPAQPVSLGSLTLSGIPTGIFISGTYAYVSSQNNSQELQVINITNPAAPAVAGSFNAAGGQDGRSVYAVGQTVYLTRASGSGQDFIVIDVTNPSVPSQLGSLDMGTLSNEIYVTGGYAFVGSADDTQEIKAIDVSSPVAMTIDDSLDLAGTSDVLTVSGYNSTIIVGRSGGEVHLVDISDPLNLSLINPTAFDQGGQVNDLSLNADNQYFFAASSEPAAELQIGDITTPASPSLVNSFNESNNNIFYGVAYDEIRDRVVITGAENVAELCVLGPDIEGDWSTPLQTGAINIPGTADGWKLVSSGNYAYAVRNIAGSNPDFVVVDISNEASPAIVASLNLSSEPQNIAIIGNYAYVASSNAAQELQIIDITNPLLPAQVGSFNAAGTRIGLGVHVVGSTAYLTRDSAGGVNELQVINVASPAAPVLLGSLDLVNDANEIIVIGSFAYIASDQNNQELQVVNIANPASLTIDASLDLAGTANAETVTGSNNMLLIGTDNGRLNVVNITNPLAPTLQATFNAQAAIRDVALSADNTLAFVANDFNDMELQVIDITVPSAPLLKGYINTNPNSDLNGVAYEGSLDVVVAVGEDDASEFIVVAP